VTVNSKENLTKGGSAYHMDPDISIAPRKGFLEVHGMQSTAHYTGEDPPPTRTASTLKRKHYIGLNPAEALKQRHIDFLDRTRPSEMKLKKNAVLQPVESTCIHDIASQFPLELLDVSMPQLSGLFSIAGSQKRTQRNLSVDRR